MTRLHGDSITLTFWMMRNKIGIFIGKRQQQKAGGVPPVEYRNLWRGTKVIDNTASYWSDAVRNKTSVSGETTDGFAYLNITSLGYNDFVNQSYSREIGRKYTLSFYINVDESESGYFTFAFVIGKSAHGRLIRADGTVTEYEIQPQLFNVPIRDLSGLNGARFEFMYERSEGTEPESPTPDAFFTTNNGLSAINLYKFQLEEGDAATPWTPNQEDN